MLVCIHKVLREAICPSTRGHYCYIAGLFEGEFHESLVIHEIFTLKIYIKKLAFA